MLFFENISIAARYELCQDPELYQAIPRLVGLSWGLPRTPHRPRFTIETPSQWFRPCLSYSTEVHVSSSCLYLSMGLIGLGLNLKASGYWLMAWWFLGCVWLWKLKILLLQIGQGHKLFADCVCWKLFFCQGLPWFIIQCIGLKIHYKGFQESIMLLLEHFSWSHVSLFSSWWLKSAAEADSSISTSALIIQQMWFQVLKGSKILIVSQQCVVYKLSVLSTELHPFVAPVTCLRKSMTEAPIMHKYDKEQLKWHLSSHDLWNTHYT